MHLNKLHLDVRLGYNVVAYQPSYQPGSGAGSVDRITTLVQTVTTLETDIHGPPREDGAY